MVHGIGQVMEEEFYSIEESFDGGRCFDLDYEFDAPRCFDFSSPETDWEAKEAELWFNSAESYPPSPFVIKLKWRCDINEDGEFSNGSIECDEYSGEACNGCCGGTQVAKTDSRAKATPSKSSTFMKPTASYLAKQNQSRMGLSNQFQNRLHKSADRFNKSGSFNEDATKRQKLEVGYLRKVAHLKHQSKFEHKEPKTVKSLDGIPTKPKATIPREPELQTARRAQRNRSKNQAESDESAKSKVHSFKALPLNKKILEAPSLPLPKKSLPEPPKFQILGKEDMPSLNEAIAIIRAEKGRRKVMVVENKQVESSTLVTRAVLEGSNPLEKQNIEGRSEGTRTVNNDSLWCTYCKNLVTPKRSVGGYMESLR
ncbi:ERECTA-like 1 [Hibiscus syriacus]|uniref:ERECTA-like 1 n=1 Tax=Hibiscus syriacus TaxID=106335 RepID=A0A6A3C599_HIBSY|nr:ERECTA-like 1 [Hibiscus syriacus]